MEILPRITILLLTCLLEACATEPLDVAVFPDSPPYYASVLVGARPHKCLVVIGPTGTRSFMPCSQVIAFVRDHVHPPAHAPVQVVLRTDDDQPAFDALCADLIGAGFDPNHPLPH